MLEPDQWDRVLGPLCGQLYRGTERIETSACLNAIGVPTDWSQPRRMQVGKLLVSAMRRLGWTGPKMLRVNGKTASGYWRVPCAPPRLELGAGEEALEGGAEDDLPTALEHVTRLGLRKLARVLRAPTDLSDGNLLRSQVTAAGIAVNAQLRADEARLRAKVTGDVLERLLQAIERERRRVGKGEGEAEVLPSLSELRGGKD